MNVRPIAGFPTYYITDKGHVFRLLPGRGLREVRTRLESCGYVRAWLYHPEREKVQVAKAVSRLVLEAFVGPPPTSTHQADHIDGNRANNALDNLRWTTPAENIAHAITRAGGRPHLRRGAGSSIARLSHEQVAEIVKRFHWGEPAKALAKEFGVTAQTVRNLVKKGAG